MKDGLRRQNERAPQNMAGEDPQGRPLSAELVSREEQLAELNLRFENFTDAIRAFGNVLYEAKRDGAPPIRIAYLCRRLAECHIGRGEVRETLEYLDEARSILSRKPVCGDPAAVVEMAVVDARASKAYYDLGKYKESKKYGLSAYEALRSTNLNTEIGRIELTLGGTWFRLGDMEHAKEFCQRALASFERDKAEEDLANAYNNLGLVCKSACQWKEATKYLEKARLLAEKLGHTYGVASRCLNLGIVKIKLSEWELAGYYLDQALRRFSEIGNQAGAAKARIALGQLHLKRREWTACEEDLNEGLAIAKRGAFGREALLAKEFLGELALERGDVEEAGKILHSALQETEALGNLADVEGEITRRLAEVCLARGDAGEALEYARRSSEICARAGDVYEELLAKRARGRASLDMGKTLEGRTEIEQVLGRLRDLGERYQVARTLVYIAAFQVGKAASEHDGGGSRVRAMGRLREASEIFAALELKGLQAEVQLEIAKAEQEEGNTDRALDALDRGLALLEKMDEPVVKERLVAARKVLEKAFAPDSELASGEMRTFLEVDRLIKLGSSVEEVLTAVLRSVLSRTGGDRGFVVIHAKKERPSIACAVGMDQDEANRVLSILQSKTGRAVSNGVPLVVTNVARDSRLSAVSDSLAGFSSLVLMPFSLPWEAGSKVFIARNDDNPLGSFTQTDLNKLAVLMSFATTALVEMERSQLSRENVKLKGELKSRFLSDGIVTRNHDMLEILRLIEKVGDTRATVLLEGETGTGKGLLARAIHRASRRRSGPFIPINCAALPEPLLESELFGHMHGAFTGTVSDKRGLFEEADGGTVFLDEVDKTSSSVQSKLLHVLDRQEVRPVGSNKWRKVDVRVICATNIDLKDMIASRTFLDDLYYRMNDIDIKVPPLRDRRDDIPVLAAHFVHVFSEEFGKKVGGITPAVMERFASHPWKGNVRELEKVVKRMVMLSEDGKELGLDLLPEAMRPQVNGGSKGFAVKGHRLRDEVARTERRAISEALEACGWNKSEVARRLAISYPCLLKKIRELEIDRRRRPQNGAPDS
jgi:Nif-specific regulatory protein